MDNINYLAAVVAAVSSFVIGGVWYSPILFAKAWQREAGLTDALLDFVTDPRASRNDKPVVQDLHEIAPGMVPVLEAMVLDGVEARADVAAYVHAVLFGINVATVD